VISLTAIDMILRGSHDLGAIYVALGGAAGSLLRYYVGIWVTNATGARSPGTLAVNVLGSFAIGLFLGMSVARSWSSAVVLLVAVGFLGGFTTFSAFSWQTYQLAESGHFGRAALNVSASLLFCLLAVWAGAALAKAV
jgi:CrcB protein